MNMPRLNSKIIGFTISSQRINREDVDVFGTGLRLVVQEHAGLLLSLWGIGDIESCIIGTDVSLSFPLHDSLEDRNVMIRKNEHGYTIENDWLGSIPVFYNTETRSVSTLIRHTIHSSAIDQEGMAMYLDLGYSALQRTPMHQVRFMRYYSALHVSTSSIREIHKADPVIERLRQSSTPSRAIDLIETKISDIERVVTGTTLLPLSGGFDSRFIASCLDKTRTKAYTYGLSDDQSQSVESVKAQRVAQTLGIPWTQIPLGGFNAYADHWYRLFGPSTQLHGMYHIEFYRRMREQIGEEPCSLASGIIGDAWSGNVKIREILGSDDTLLLGYSHGMHASHTILKNAVDSHEQELFFEQHKNLLSNSAYRVVMSMRFKIVLLSYLMSIPDYIGMPSWTPFLNMEVACAQLTLPASDRSGRLWQKSYFGTLGIDIESMTLRHSKQNSLNFQSLKIAPLEKLDSIILSTYMNPRKIRAINRRYQKLVNSKGEYGLLPRIMRTQFVAGLMRRMHVSYNYMKPYYEVMTLKSIEMTLAEFNQP